jgi:hypothetical protein
MQDKNLYHGQDSHLFHKHKKWERNLARPIEVRSACPDIAGDHYLYIRPILYILFWAAPVTIFSESRRRVIVSTS